MHKLGNYIEGSWYTGEGEGVPLHDAVTGEVVAYSSVEGLDLDAVLRYGRRVGSPPLRKMTFQQRGMMLKKLAQYLLKRKEAYYELSTRTGATRADSWIDIEGGIGNLFANASLRKEFPNQPFHVEGAAIDLSRGGDFMGHHIMVPKRGVAVHLNAYNFPVWGMLEKCAVNWMAGVPAVVKPALPGSFLTEAVVRDIIKSGILPEGALQLVGGLAHTILDYVQTQDVVTFTGSAETGRKLKTHPQIIAEAVLFNLEADSLNAAVLGEDATVGTPEFDLFIKEARKEMTVKCGQKCTAIRRIIVPTGMMDAVQEALSKQLARTSVGNPATKGVRMGALVGKEQREVLWDRVQLLGESADLVYGTRNPIDLIEADFDNGAFTSPMLFRTDDPHNNRAVHEVEAFGPVATLMPYRDLDDAVELAHMGKGSLVCSIATYDDEIARDFVVNAAASHGRILVLNRESAKQSTGHGSPLPTLVHGGPGRAGGGEEMGGMRGVKHYLQRTAIQGSPTTITAITGIYQPGAKVTEAPQHPFKYHFEDIEAGMSLLTHKRTMTDSDIQNFANLTWDHFYAHTDITSLEGTIFEKRAAHGYFVLAAGAGLFVYPGTGPVGANYGLEDCRFIRPVYHNDTLQVRLTCKEKIDRDTRGRAFPAGVVKWYEEILDQDGELVAFATILTLVQKKSPFAEISADYLQKNLEQISDQNTLERMTQLLKMATGEVVVENKESEEAIDMAQTSLYNYRPMPGPISQWIDLPESPQFDDLASARVGVLEAYRNYKAHFKGNAGATAATPIFGEMDRFLWKLMLQKAFAYEFR